jgi:hypothetical protein
MTWRRAGAVGLLALGLALAGTLAMAQKDDPPKAQKEPAAGTPRERVDALSKKYDDAMQSFSTKYSQAKTDEERSKLFQNEYPKANEYAKEFLEIAKAHPDDPAAFDALSWIVQHSGGGSDPASTSAIDQLARDHVANPKIAGLLSSLQYGPTSGRVLLEAVLEKNPDHDAKAQACFTLAKKIKQDAEYAQRMKRDQNFLAQLGQFFGDAESKRLAKAKPEDLEKQAEAMFERVVKEFADVKGFRGTLGEAAERELFEMRNLAIGKVAPDIEGEDIDGARFKLSDYRGKVVLLDFWGDW